MEIENWFLKSALVIFVTWTFGCSQKRFYDSFANSIVKKDVRTGGEEIYLPSVLWDYIDKDIESYYFSEDALYTVPRDYFELSAIFLNHENDFALRENMEFQFPKGGGFIDLAKVLRGASTSRFVFTVNFKDGAFFEKVKVLHISNGKKANHLGASRGSGCNVFHDVTTFFKQHIWENGLVVRAIPEVYLPLLSGHFIFYIISMDHVSFSQITIYDSRYPKSNCRDLF